jgi:hypothetical protein
VEPPNENSLLLEADLDSDSDTLCEHMVRVGWAWTFRMGPLVGECVPEKEYLLPDRACDQGSPHMSSAVEEGV